MQRRQFAHVDQRRPADGDYPDRLVRLIEELRALDLERRRQPVTSSAFRDLARRMEAKAREVFELAATAGPASMDVNRERTAGRPH
jgi:hypothetical protein